jgi:hypothetical protein
VLSKGLGNGSEVRVGIMTAANESHLTLAMTLTNDHLSLESTFVPFPLH